jgi:hypothetical protein
MGNDENRAGAAGAIFVIAHSGRRDREYGRNGWIRSEGKLQHGTSVRNPHGKPDRDRVMLSRASPRSFPDAPSRSPLPGRPDPPAGSAKEIWVGPGLAASVQELNDVARGGSDSYSDDPIQG